MRNLETPRLQREHKTQFAARSRLIRELPTAPYVAVQLGLFALVPALLVGVRDRNAVVLILLAAIAVAILADATSGVLHVPVASRVPLLRSSHALVVALIGVAAFAARTYFDPAYAVQVGTASRSPFSAFLSPFDSWALVGIALLIYYGKGNERRRTLLGVAAIAGAMTGLWMLNGFVNAAAQFAFAALGLLIAAGYIKVRHLIALMAVAILVWPAVMSVRNAVRADAFSGTGYSYYQAVDPYARLRADEFWMSAIEVRETESLERRSLASTVRVGLIPSAIDADRRIESTGRYLGRTLLHQETTSVGFGTLGNVFLFDGFFGVLLYLAAGSTIAHLLLKRRGPLAFALYGGLLYECYWMATTYPDNISGFLQYSVAAAVAFAVVQALSKTHRPRGSQRRAHADAHHSPPRRLNPSSHPPIPACQDAR